MSKDVEVDLKFSGTQRDKGVSRSQNEIQDKRETKTGQNINLDYLGARPESKSFSRKPAPRNRLRDDSEKIAYFFALLVVGTIILLGKSLGWLSPWAAAVLGVVSITSYAAFAWISQRENPVRADRLGDNCYYLGLVYTLASLIASLIAINNGADVNALLGNFGVALVSTAAGIVARLVMIQLKAESDDVDQRARIALAETAQAMQSDLLGAADTFRTLMIDAQETFRLSVDRTRRSLEDASEVSRRIEQLDISPERLNNSLVGVVRNIETSAESIASVGDRMREQTNSVVDTADAIERADRGIEHIHKVLERIAVTLENQRLASEKAMASMEVQARRTEAHARRMEQHAVEAQEATSKVYKAMGDLASSIVGRLR